MEQDDGSPEPRPAPPGPMSRAEARVYEKLVRHGLAGRDLEDSFAKARRYMALAPSIFGEPPG